MIMGLFNEHCDEIREQFAKGGASDELYVNAQYWKSLAEDHKFLRDKEVQRLNSIIESQLQSHVWELQELERENTILKAKLEEYKKQFGELNL